MKSFLDFEEKNVEKAVQKACADLNVTQDKLKYDIISHGSSGIFGLVGSKKALIRVFVPEAQKEKLSARSSAAVSQPADESQANAAAPSENMSINALVDEAFGEVSATAQPIEKSSKKPPAVKAKQKNGPPVNTKIGKEQKPTETETNPKEKPTEDPIEDEASSNHEAALAVASDLAREIFKTMDVDAELSVNKDSNQCWINIKVAEPGILIGKRGQTLEAIQYLSDKVVNKQCGKGNRVIFDVEGYVESRKTELKELASRLASKAVKTGKPSTMTRMNAHDRRIVHVSLKKNRSVRTQSVGDGYYRKLIIFPKKKSARKADKGGARK